MKKKRKPKKGKIKETPKKEHGMLREALADINREISMLNRQKNEYKKTERELKEKIKQLIKKEAMLKSAKKGIEQKKESLSTRLSRVQKIKFELSEI